jgi:O-antigen ligase
LKELISPRNAVAAGGVVIMLGFIYLSFDNPIIGIAAIFLMVCVVALVALGYENTTNLLMLLGMFTAPTNSLRPSAAVSFVTFSDLFFLVGIGLLIPKLIKSRANVPTPYALGALMMFSAGLIASWFANDVAISTNVLFRLVAASIILPVAFILWNPSAKMLDSLAIVYVLGQIMSVVGALANGKDAESGRYSGFTVHFNFFALCSLQALVFGFFLLHRLRPSLRPYVWASMAICSFGVLLSGSRAGLGAMVVIALMYPFWEKSGAKLIALICGALLMIVMFPVLAQIGGEGSALNRIGSAQGSSSNYLRVWLFQESWNAFVSRPWFGVGFEHALDAQNIFLQVLSSAGLIGFVGFMMMMWSITKPLFNLDGPMHRLGWGAFAYLLQGALTASLWDRMVWAGLSMAFLATLWPISRRREACDGIDPVHSITMHEELDRLEAEEAEAAAARSTTSAGKP